MNVKGAIIIGPIKRANPVCRAEIDTLELLTGVEGLSVSRVEESRVT